MNAKKVWFIVAGFSLLLVLAIKLFAISSSEKSQIENYGVSTLKGLQGFRLGVAVVDTSKDKENGETYIQVFPERWKEDIQTDVELVLRRNGVKIFTGEKSTEEVSAFLSVYVVVNSILIELPKRPLFYLYSFQVSVDVIAPAVISWKPYTTTTLTRTIIWPAGGFNLKRITISGRKPLKQAIKEDVLRQINSLCNDYYAANPKETSVKSKDNK